MTDTNSELDGILEDVEIAVIYDADYSVDKSTGEAAKKKAKATINRLLLKARRDELNSIVRDDIDDRIAELDTQIQEGTE